MWSYTPRVIAGFMHYAFERRKVDMAESLHIHALAAQGTGKQITELVKKLTPPE